MSRAKIFHDFKDYSRYVNYDFRESDLQRFKFSEDDLKGIDVSKLGFKYKKNLDKCENNKENLWNDIIKNKFKIGLSQKFDKNKNFPVKSRSFTVKEIQKDSDYGFTGIYYISDIHLDERVLDQFKNREVVQNDEIKAFINKVAKRIYDQVHPDCIGLFIVGDLSHNQMLITAFFESLNDFMHEKRFNVFYVLGNHELWSLDTRKKSLPEQTLCNLRGNLKRFYWLKILENELVGLIPVYRYLGGERKVRFNWIVLKGDDVLRLSNEELLDKFNLCEFIGLFGIGYAGKNQLYNANTSMYHGALLSRDDEIKRSNYFNSLYEKVEAVFSNNTVYDEQKGQKARNIFIVTHMPKEDWGNVDYDPNFIYIHGHTHNNFWISDPSKTILADAQVGYKSRVYHVGYWPIERYKDVYYGLKEGIYKSNRREYLLFNQSHQINCSLKREWPIYVLKRKGYYLFMTVNEKGKLFLLNGGIYKAIPEGKDLNYFYENMDVYANAINLFLKPYIEWQENVAEIVSSIGGTGYIHGAIVDIDYFHHLFLNPFDHKITAYYALNIVDKWVFPNFMTMLKSDCPELFEKGCKIPKGNYPTTASELFEPANDKKSKEYIAETDIYKISGLIKSMQYSFSDARVIRTWNDGLVQSSSKEDEKKLALAFLENQCNR